MKLKSFSYIISLLTIFFCSSLFGEEKNIDIWKNQSGDPSSINKKTEKTSLTKSNPNAAQTIQASEKIQIQEGEEIELENQNIFGIYEPASYDLNLNMWSTTKADDLRSSLKRLNKIELSKSSNEILESILFSFSYPPKGMSDKEFVDLKINWLIKNNRTNLIENFLKQHFRENTSAELPRASATVERTYFFTTSATTFRNTAA